MVLHVLETHDGLGLFDPDLPHVNEASSMFRRVCGHPLVDVEELVLADKHVDKILQRLLKSFLLGRVGLSVKLLLGLEVIHGDLALLP